MTIVTPHTPAFSHFYLNVYVCTLSNYFAIFLPLHDHIDPLPGKLQCNCNYNVLRRKQKKANPRGLYITLKIHRKNPAGSLFATRKLFTCHAICITEKGAGLIEKPFVLLATSTTIAPATLLL